MLPVAKDTALEPGQFPNSRRCDIVLNMAKEDVVSSDCADDVILRRVIDGETDAFEEVLDRYGGLVFSIARKHVPVDQVDDITQEVFLRAYRSLPTFKAQSSFKHWLSVIAVRTCYDFWRDRYKSKELPMSALSEEHQTWLENTMATEAEEVLRERGSQKEAREILDWALARLSPEDRMVTELVYLEEASVKEAAELLGWSVANVKVRLFRVRKKLHTMLGGAMNTGGG